MSWVIYQPRGTYSTQGAIFCQSRSNIPCPFFPLLAVSSPTINRCPFFPAMLELLHLGTWETSGQFVKTVDFFPDLGSFSASRSPAIRLQLPLGHLGTWLNRSDFLFSSDSLISATSENFCLSIEVLPASRDV